KPTHPLLLQAKAAGLAVITDIDLFFQRVKVPVAGVTGTNGKSSVTMMLSIMAKKSGKRILVAGNIGNPVLNFTDKDIAECDFIILELSSYQLALSKDLPLQAAVNLNIAHDHIDWHGDYQNYFLAKQRIYNACKIPIMNRDIMQENLDEHTAAITFGADEAKPGHFGLSKDNEDIYLCYGDRRLVAGSALTVRGRHNYENALSALALGHAMGLPMTEMISGLIEFQGLEHRCQWLGVKAGVHWYNDSKATNMVATTTAIKSVSQQHSKQIIWLGGGLAKQEDLSVITNILRCYVKQVILFGEDALKLSAHVPAVTQMLITESLVDAVKIAFSLAQSQDVILFSPACASFDMFDNFEHRGQVFTEQVMQLVDEQ
ncbi:MAG: UDP-N-acetylmuramoyl-L-alanine--D-glutamate ligase, partial [Gammaproteobacteria bacterium]|nr:UDP-N-acetylmuramoyl-L-alanine--D-glutamate ligase [Gammaproteobacteria bacterium]